MFVQRHAGDTSGSAIERRQLGHHFLRAGIDRDQRTEGGLTDRRIVQDGC
jgi:hypothetical protein